MLSYIYKIVKKIKLQMKAPFFNPSNPIFIICFHVPFKPAYNTIRTHGEAAMWILPFYINNALTMALNSLMSAATHIASGVALVITVEQATQKKYLRFYPGVVNYLFEKFANDEAIAKMDIAMYKKPTNMTAIKCVGDLYTNWCKVANVYDEAKLYIIFIERVDSSVCHSVRENQPCIHMWT